MKKVILGSLLAATALVATSCDNGFKGDYPSLYAFATVAENTVHDGVAQSEATLSFAMDNSKTFVVSQSKYEFDYEELLVGERVVAGLNLLTSDNAAYDYTAELYDVVRVSMGECHVVTTEAESVVIVDNPLSYINTYATLSYGYLNLFMGFITNNIDEVSYALVENQIGGVDEDSDYLELELRLNKATTSSTGTAYERYVSFDVEPFRERLEGKSGIKLRVRTSLSGTAELVIKSDKLFE